MICWIEAHPGLAAWVQAVFSVIAILAAIGIAVWQRHADHKARRDAEAEGDKRVRSIATMGANLALRSINSTAEIAKVVALQVYREGAVARLQQGIQFFTRVDLTRLTQEEAEAIAATINGCTSAIAMLMTAIDADNDATRNHLAGGLYGVRKAVGDIQKVFPGVTN